MKEKILEALKTKYKNLGFDDKAFDGVASFLKTTVTEESQIETVVNNSQAMLTSIQGEVDRRVTSVANKKDSEISALQAKLNTPPTTSPTTPPTNPPSSGSDVLLQRLEAIEKQNQSILDARTKDEQAQKANQLRTQAKAIMKEKGISDSLCDKLLTKVSISEDSSADSIAEIGIKDYNDLKADFTPEAGDVSNSQLGDVKKVNEDYWSRRKMEVENQRKLEENVK